mmetsp:Transcript_21884/g.56289  ORF Transcript_21884/g.56289 Transcript_21884/m.56289 type:complete len:205 (+) Transcript_21884:1470-2084(+)
MMMRLRAASRPGQPSTTSRPNGSNAPAAFSCSNHASRSCSARTRMPGRQETKASSILGMNVSYQNAFGIIAPGMSSSSDSQITGFHCAAYELCAPSPRPLRASSVASAAASCAYSDCFALFKSLIRFMKVMPVDSLASVPSAEATESERDECRDLLLTRRTADWILDLVADEPDSSACRRRWHARSSPLKSTGLKWAMRRSRSA